MSKVDVLAQVLASPPKPAWTRTHNCQTLTRLQQAHSPYITVNHIQSQNSAQAWLAKADARANALPF